MQYYVAYKALPPAPVQRQNGQNSTALVAIDASDGSFTEVLVFTALGDCYSSHLQLQLVKFLWSLPCQI